MLLRGFIIFQFMKLIKNKTRQERSPTKGGDKDESRLEVSFTSNFSRHWPTHRICDGWRRHGLGFVVV